MVAALEPSETEKDNSLSEVAEAARSWGRSCSTPVAAVESLRALRAALGTVLAGRARGEILLRISALLEVAMTEAVRCSTRNLEADARADSLTGCANRRALEEDLPRAVAEAHRSGLDLSVAVIDLDGLKAINDTRGHHAGDLAIQKLVTTLRASLRETDRLYRFGGDEFVVIAPFTSSEGANRIMRRAVESGAPRFTWGVASLLASPGAFAGDPAAALIERADSDMYDRRRRARGASRSASHGTGWSIPERRVLLAGAALLLALAGASVALSSTATSTHHSTHLAATPRRARASQHSRRNMARGGIASASATQGDMAIRDHGGSAVTGAPATDADNAAGTSSLSGSQGAAASNPGTAPSGPGQTVTLPADLAGGVISREVSQTVDRSSTAAQGLVTAATAALRNATILHLHLPPPLLALPTPISVHATPLALPATPFTP